jgi:hypothetical protein
MRKSFLVSVDPNKLYASDMMITTRTVLTVFTADRSRA